MLLGGVEPLTYELQIRGSEAQLLVFIPLKQGRMFNPICLYPTIATLRANKALKAVMDPDNVSKINGARVATPALHISVLGRQNNFIIQKLPK